MMASEVREAAFWYRNIFLFMSKKKDLYVTRIMKNRHEKPEKMAKSRVS